MRIRYYLRRGGDRKNADTLTRTRANVRGQVGLRRLRRFLIKGVTTRVQTGRVVTTLQVRTMNRRYYDHDVCAIGRYQCATTNHASGGANRAYIIVTTSLARGIRHVALLQRVFDRTISGGLAFGLRTFIVGATTTTSDRLQIRSRGNTNGDKNENYVTSARFANVGRVVTLISTRVDRFRTGNGDLFNLLTHRHQSLNRIVYSPDRLFLVCL